MMATGNYFDVSGPIAILEGVMARAAEAVKEAYTETAEILMPVVDEQIPFDMYERYFHQAEATGEASIMAMTQEELILLWMDSITPTEHAEIVPMRLTSKGEPLLENDVEFHMQYSLYFGQDSGNPFHAYCGTRGFEYALFQHETPMNHSKASAKDHYLSEPVRDVGFPALKIALGKQTGKLVAR
jgi:hypothetical protein